MRLLKTLNDTNRQYICFYILFSQWEFFAMGNSVRFSQGKPAATGSRYPTLINYEVHAGFFRASIMHRTLTWTTGSVTCVREHSYDAWVYTHTHTHTHDGWAQRQRVSTTFLTQKCSHKSFLCSWRGSNLRSWVWCSTHWATPSPLWGCTRKRSTSQDRWTPGYINADVVHMVCGPVKLFQPGMDLHGTINHCHPHWT